MRPPCAPPFGSMNRLERLLAERIEKGGPITFREFMELALYHPQWGYYSSSADRIGKGGDFFTSSSVGTIFGRLLARQVAEMLETLPPPWVVVEMGAGQGHLSRDVVHELSRLLPGGFTYGIVERSPAMRERQRGVLKDLSPVEWRDDIRDFAPFCGVVFSNELVDSFPVHLVEMTEEGLKEVYLDAGEGGLVEVLLDPSTPELEAYFRELGVALPPGFRTEVNLEAVGWIHEVADALKGGFVITIDYGYPSHELYQSYRSRGTLMAYRGHRASEELYSDPGEQDLTSHVNFSALKHWGEKVGLVPLGFTDQSHFLLGLGILDLISAGDGAPDMSEVLKAKTLIMPGGMGDTFKVLMQAKGVDSSWAPSGLKEAPLRRSFEL